MKKTFALVLCLLMACLCLTGYAEESAEQAERTVASYTYALAEGGSDYVENLIFNEDVVIHGNNAQIIFSNCEFNGDVVLTADEGTRVLLLGCDVNGSCVMRNNVREADVDYANPKFLVDTPVTVVCEDCVGSVVAMGDFEVAFNGETYAMADSQFFIDMSAAEYALVPYEGQEASYYVVAQWYENDEKTVMVLCEYDPGM